MYTRLFSKKREDGKQANVQGKELRPRREEQVQPSPRHLDCLAY